MLLFVVADVSVDTGVIVAICCCCCCCLLLLLLLIFVVVADVADVVFTVVITMFIIFTEIISVLRLDGPQQTYSYHKHG